MTKKYSSFKNHQLITENWRKYLAEEEPPAAPTGTLPEEGTRVKLRDRLLRTYAGNFEPLRARTSSHNQPLEGVVTGVDPTGKNAFHLDPKTWGTGTVTIMRAEDGKELTFFAGDLEPLD
tara:strand:- start:301 stop:660 length:360 start_codon:yes stop_codon:yes gene_type:complete